MSVVLITGCSSGFGLGAALALARRGETVIATVRDLTRGRSLWSAEAMPPIDVVELDVTDPESRRTAIGHAQETYGHIDVLINNAGIFSFGAAETLGEDDLRALFETNLFGAFAMTQAVLPGMRARRAGRIVNVTSLAAFATRPFMTGYCATKHALEAMTAGLDGELAPFGIRSVSVAAAAFATGIVRSAPDPGSPYGEAPIRFFSGFRARMQSRPDITPVVEAIVDAATSPMPRRRYLVAPDGPALDALVAEKERIEGAR